MKGHPQNSVTTGADSLLPEGAGMDGPPAIDIQSTKLTLNPIRCVQIQIDGRSTL